jgi:hypothetical protein
VRGYAGRRDDNASRLRKKYRGSAVIVIRYVLVNRGQRIADARRR